MDYRKLLGDSTNASADPFGYAGPQNGADAFLNTGGSTPPATEGFDFKGLFSDPNFIRALGELGAIGGPGSVGEIAGQAGSQMARRQAVQREGEKVANNNRTQTIQEKMIASLQDGSLLSPTSDNVRGDKFETDGDGNWKLTGKKSPDPVIPLEEQKGLDAITNTPEQPTAGGSNLRDFPSDQGSNVADFSGLDPADVGMILGARQSAGSLTQRAVTRYMQNKYRNKELDARTKASQARLSQAEKKLTSDQQQKILERKQKIEDKQDERKFKISMKLFEKELAKAEPGSLEEKKAIADIDNLNSQIKERDARVKNGGMTPYQVEQNKRAEIKLKMSIDKVEATKKKDAMEQQKDALKYEETIIDNIDDEAIAPMMDYVNQNSNKSYYYTQYIDDGEGLFNLAGDTLGAKLPLVTKNGVQMDMASVRASAAQYNMSVEDFLASPGIGILTKGDNNDYQPANR